VYDELPDVTMKTKPKNHDFEQRINQSFGILRKSACAMRFQTKHQQPEYTSTTAATAHQQLEMMDYRAGH
jgi:hypothetical protein